MTEQYLYRAYFRVKKQVYGWKLTSEESLLSAFYVRESIVKMGKNGLETFDFCIDLTLVVTILLIIIVWTSLVSK